MPWRQRCLLCEGPAGSLPLCAHCGDALPWLGPACRACALPLPSNLDPPLCGSCRVQPTPFERTIAPLRYESYAIGWIARLKRHAALSEADLLAHLIASVIRTAYRDQPLPDAMVPVPLATSRLLRRGYNQAMLIARPLSRAVDTPLAARGVTRLRATRPQRGLGRSARQRNIAGAFDSRHDWAGRIVAIVDDVMTTGSTAAGVARALHAAGAGGVHVWVAARTPSS